MILLYTILFILFESITEGLLKRHNKAEWLFIWWVQWLTAFALFAIWFLIAYNFDKYYVPTAKLIAGFIFVRLLIFDPAWNLANGQKLGYYGTTKFYDIIMKELGGWGYFMKIVCGIVGICFLLGWS